MKIGVLTFHRPYNYGALLQALATQEIIHQNWGETEIVDYRHSRIESERSYFRKVESRKFMTVFGDLRYFLIERKRHISFDHYREKVLNLSAKCESTGEVQSILNGYDVIVIGSDLVWNWELDENLNDVFFCEFDSQISKRIVSYASSIGSDYIPEEYRELYGKKLKKFYAVSVREETALRLLQPVVDKEIKVVLDPTLLLNRDTWNLYKEEYSGLPQKYICAYILEHTEDAIEIVETIAGQMKLPVVYFNKKNRFACNGQSAYNANPGQFLYIVENASIVITNSFHGTVFSILYNKEFICIPHTTRGSRMKDLLSKIELSNRLTGKKADLSESRSVIDYERVNYLLDMLRQESIHYLECAITGKREM